MDFISIIISTYKGLNVIFDCVKSALSQDYKSYEVIVVDDNGLGTPEQIATENILRQFKAYDNFKYITHETNINGSAARNTGIRNARGNYIAFLDDDDILRSDSIRLRYQKLMSMPLDYGIVFSSFEQFIEDKKDFDCVFDFEGNILEDYLLQKIHSPSSILMMRKSVFDDVGLWDESFRRHQDWEIVTRILFKYKACSILETTVKRVICYRNNAKSPVVFEQQRLYFLTKMNSIINTFDPKRRKQIYFVHYVDIGKNYIKYKKIFTSIKWAFKSKNPFKAIHIYFVSGINFIKKKR